MQGLQWQHTHMTLLSFAVTTASQHRPVMLLLCCCCCPQALNEFDLRATDWRKKLESQRGAVLAFETKNNLAKIAKWTMCALLAGADMVKLGYVSRAGPKDNSNHVILGTQVRLRVWGLGLVVEGAAVADCLKDNSQRGCHCCTLAHVDAASPNTSFAHFWLLHVLLPPCPTLHLNATDEQASRPGHPDVPQPRPLLGHRARAGGHADAAT
jgi:hypothetical protein